MHHELVKQVEAQAAIKMETLGELLRSAGISDGAWAKWKKNSGASLEYVEKIASGAGECLTLLLDPDPAKSRVHFGTPQGGGLVVQYPESRQIALIVDGLDEQGRREVLDFATRYLRAAGNPTHPSRAQKPLGARGRK